MECLNEIIKDLRARKYQNKRMFALKNQVKFSVTGEEGWEKGFIIKTTPKYVFDVLEDDVFKANAEVK